MPSGILPENIIREPGRTKVALWNQWPGLLRDLPGLGTVFSMTRNRSAVLGRRAVLVPWRVSENGMRAVSDNWETAFALGQWARAWAVEAVEGENLMQSIEITDWSGRLVHKVCLCAGSNRVRFGKLIAAHQAIGIESSQQGPDPGAESMHYVPAARGERVLCPAEILRGWMARLVGTGMPVRVWVGVRGHVVR